MTDNNLTPPPELVEEWRNEWHHAHGELASYIATQAARWAADAELEACCDQLQRWGVQGLENLRNTRRPEQPSLKEQALAELHHLVMSLPGGTTFTDATIRRALELVPEGPDVTPAADDRGPGSVTEQASPVATDEELESRYVGAHGPNLPGVLRAIYDLGYEHGSQDIEAIEGAPVPPDAAAPDRPLWVEMRDVYSDPSRIHWSGHGFARELRVVADWLEYHIGFGDKAPVRWLRAEAERAEAP